MINKKTMGNLKLTSVGNSATDMPEGLGGLPITTAIATARLKKSIAEVEDIISASDFIDRSEGAQLLFI